MVQERAFDFLRCTNVQRITTADTPAPYSPTLLKEWLPNAQLMLLKQLRKLCISNYIKTLYLKLHRPYDEVFFYYEKDF